MKAVSPATKQAVFRHVRAFPEQPVKQLIKLYPMPERILRTIRKEALKHAVQLPTRASIDASIIEAGVRANPFATRLELSKLANCTKSSVSRILAELGYKEGWIKLTKAQVQSAPHSAVGTQTGDLP